MAKPELIETTSFVLTHLDLYNWGTFAGRHCAEIDASGTAIIGPTGSGKTTLVDAFMTLLNKNPRYNLASTGGHESDRNLVAYVRGKFGSSNDSQHVTRKGKTMTGIAARFVNGTTQLCIGGLFWLEGTSSAAADMKSVWIFSQAEGQGLDEWLNELNDKGSKALKQMRRDIAGLEIFDTKKDYLARLHNIFEVGNNAFALLNRTAGLKQLNSIDEVFREWVLDENAAFEQAGEVVGQFDNLTDIHNELETARKQQESLLPIQQSRDKREAAVVELTQRQLLQDIVPLWYAEHGCRLWEERIQHLQQQIAEKAERERAINQKMAELSEQADTLYDVYIQAGGSSIELLKEKIKNQRKVVQESQFHAKNYQNLLRNLQLELTELTTAALHENQALAETHQTELNAQYAQDKQHAQELGAKELNQHNEAQDLQQERQAIAQRRSNIPEEYQKFRSDLAEQLNLAEIKLPFVAELLEVKEAEQQWRGAIERAIGGQRLYLLVPPEVMQTALDWINHRHNKVHVRLHEVVVPVKPAHFFDDGFTRKLNFKTHDYREALKHLLARIDRHCVDSPEALRHTEQAMTAQGLMSGRKHFFEKQDHMRLDQNWMTGFDNRDRLASLDKKIATAKAAWRKLKTDKEAAEQQVEHSRQQLELLKTLLTVQFDDIDLPSAEAQLATLSEQLQALEDPQSDVGQARKKWLAVKAELKTQQHTKDELLQVKGQLKGQQNSAEKNKQGFQARLDTELTPAQRELVAQKLTVPEAEQLDNLNELERLEMVKLKAEVDKFKKNLQSIENNLIRAMEKAKNVDTGTLSEVGTEMDDVPSYLQRLQILTEEALPEKLQRFLDYLNQSSDEGVTQLLAHIQNEVSYIEERIADINQTLMRVDFQPGRYLRLEPRKVVHESLKNLKKAQDNLRTASLQKNDDEGKQHYKALQNIVNLLRDATEKQKQKTQSARALLDPRYRLQFAVSVIERGSETVLETRTGSQGDSGGEKESMASYVLIVSLSYSLCPEGSRRPLFGTIVLDEAFSKSSQAVASRIIAALEEFGLHPVFVTPNKELHLLRTHTRTAIVVHRKGQQATLTALSWEELDEQRRGRQ